MPTRFGVLPQALVVLAVGLGLTGCGAPTPLCDEAAVVADQGNLSLATEKFARARLAGEGECADQGLAGSAARYTEAHLSLAAAREAEATRDLEAAAAAYRTALEFDRENAAAKEALTRLGRPVPEFRVPDAVPSVPVAAETPRPGGPDLVLSIVSVVLLTALLTLFGWWLWTGRQARAHRVAVERAELELSTELLAAVDRLGARLAEAAERRDTARQALERAHRADLDAARRTLLDAVEAAGRDAGERSERLSRHLDDLTDYLGDLRHDQGGDRTVSYGPPRPGEGVG